MPAIAPNWFVALPADLSETLTQLERTVPPQVRLFVPEDMHLTVAFLGAMPEKLAPRLVKWLEKVDFEPFRFSTGQLLALPSAERCSAVSFALQEGRVQAAQLIADWRDECCQLAEVPPDTRPPLPHITVARPDRRAGADAQRAAVEWAKATRMHANGVFDRIALYTWSQDRRRRQFRIVAEKSMRK
jgi:2'-5' RNA ligase